MSKKKKSTFVAYTEVRNALLADKFSRISDGKGGIESLYGDWAGVMVVESDAIKDGDMTSVERMLFSQATALETMFVDLSSRATANLTETGSLKAAETLLRLGLKAQSQCRTTLEALVELKHPRSITVTKQANIAQQQVVNNGEMKSGGNDTHAHAREKNQNESNELLGEVHHERLDTGTSETAGGINQEMETVGAVHRSKNKGGKDTQ